MDLDPIVEADIGKKYQKRDQYFSQYAVKNSEFLRRHYYKDDEVIRPPFSRDADRILHSKAYARYIDKTQVFFLFDNDHITHRVLHVQLVSKIARTIGRAFGLNEDLIEAISLGHDIGHPPYGHIGETYLGKFPKKYKLGHFFHHVQSIRFLDLIEDLDLTIQVLDGILCHDGEVTDDSLTPEGNLSWERFDDKISTIKSGGKVKPSTYEGCIVRIADNIAYLGRDFEDAIELSLFKEEDFEQFPDSCREYFNIDFNRSKYINWTVLDTLIKDLINTSYEQKTIKFSENGYKCIKDFKDFNYNHIYYNKALHEQDEKIEFMFNSIFDYYFYCYKNRVESSWIYEHMLDCDWISKKYKETVSPPEFVRDYIAGMTDRYFEARFFEIVNPIRRVNFK